MLSKQQLNQIIDANLENTCGLFNESYAGQSPNHRADYLLYLLNNLIDIHNNTAGQVGRSDLVLDGNLPTLGEVSDNIRQLQIRAQANDDNGVLAQAEQMRGQIRTEHSLLRDAENDIVKLREEMQGYEQVYHEMDGHLEIYRHVVQDKLPEIKKTLEYQARRIESMSRQIRELKKELLTGGKPKIKEGENIRHGKKSGAKKAEKHAVADRAKGKKPDKGPEAKGTKTK